MDCVDQPKATKETSRLRKTGSSDPEAVSRDLRLEELTERRSFGQASALAGPIIIAMNRRGVGRRGAPLGARTRRGDPGPQLPGTGDPGRRRSRG